MNRDIKYFKPYLIFLFFHFNLLQAQQNLVHNPSFENITHCVYTDYCYVNLAKYWFCPYPNTATPDIFLKCPNPDLPCTCTPPGTAPINVCGHQQPRTGYVLAGMLTYMGEYKKVSKSATNYREYIETSLIHPLEKDTIYCVGFYVSLGDTFNLGISSMGAYLSNTPTIHTEGIDSCFDSTLNTNVVCYHVLHYTPQIENDSNRVLTDKKNWIKVSGKYIAKGGEQYITIGNFYNDVKTERHIDTVSHIPYGNYTYYYIDDIFVYACGSVSVQDTFSIFVPNVFTPNADGKNDLFTVKATAVSYLNLQIYNRWGSLLNEQKWQAQDSTKTNTTLSWAGRTNAGIACSAGTYFYVLTYTQSKGNSTAYKKGSFTLLR